MNYMEFAERFADQKASPVYLFAGEEKFFVDEGIRIVRDRFLEKGKEDFNYDTCSASDMGAPRVIEMAETLPLGTKWRVVIVKGVDEWSKKDKEQMISYVDNPSPATCLILTASKLDRREKFSAAVEKSGKLILCQSLHKKNIAGWIRQRVNHAGKSIDPNALSVLSENGGENLLILKQDIEKLVLYCNDRKSVTLQDVVTISSSMRSLSVFEVVDAIADRRLKDAVTSLKKALDDGEPPVRIFYFIVREFRIMLKARILIDDGKSPEEAAKLSGVPVFKVREFSERIRRFSRKELSTLFERLMKIDGLLKGGAIRPELVLEDMVLSVCRMR